MANGRSFEKVKLHKPQKAHPHPQEMCVCIVKEIPQWFQDLLQKQYPARYQAF